MIQTRRSLVYAMFVLIQLNVCLIRLFFTSFWDPYCNHTESLAFANSLDLSVSSEYVVSYPLISMDGFISSSMLCKMQVAFFLGKMTTMPYLFTYLTSEFSKLTEISLVAFAELISSALSRGGECFKSPIIGCSIFCFKFDLKTSAHGIVIKNTHDDTTLKHH